MRTTPMFKWLRRRKDMRGPLTVDRLKRTVPVSQEALNALAADYKAMKVKCCPWCDGRLSNDWPKYVVASQNEGRCVECGLQVTDIDGWVWIK